MARQYGLEEDDIWKATRRVNLPVVMSQSPEACTKT